MIIKKILNNNVVISENAQGEEVVVMGRGIAFQKSKDDTIDASFVQKIFTLRYEDIDNLDLLNMFTSFDPKVIEVATEIIRLAESMLERKFLNQIYLTLTDHINYALERNRDGIVMPNPLVYDIKRFYPKEYEVALSAIEIINKHMGVLIPKEEVGFIALHFVNSSSENSVMVTMESMTIINGILKIISNHFGTVLNEHTISFNRMVTHIQYFSQRILNNELNNDTEDAFLLDVVMTKYDKAYQCSLKIKDYLLAAHSIDVQTSELIYLTIHINRVVA